jgi:hypothetical protein
VPPPKPALVAAGVALMLVAGVSVLTLRRLDRTRPVTVDEALQRFRGGSPTSTPAPSASRSATVSPSARGGTPTATRAPAVTGSAIAGPAATATPGSTATPNAAGPRRTPEGVYVYTTTGYETADAGPSTARHDYPAETTITVRDVGCTGSSVRWDATKDRWDDVTVCRTSDASKVTRYVSYHRFFGQSETKDYTCTGDSWFRPPSTRDGYSWTFDCTTPDAKAHTVATLVGTERVRIGDGTVTALHVSYDTTLSGSSRGENPQDFWIAGPYVVRQTSCVDADVDTPFGSIRYHEEYDLRLTSRQPRT